MYNVAHFHDVGQVGLEFLSARHARATVPLNDMITMIRFSSVGMHCESANNHWSFRCCYRCRRTNVRSTPSLALLWHAPHRHPGIRRKIHRGAWLGRRRPAGALPGHEKVGRWRRTGPQGLTLLLNPKKRCNIFRDMCEMSATEGVGHTASPLSLERTTWARPGSSACVANHIASGHLPLESYDLAPL